MAGDASAWLESVKHYLQPATKMVLGMKDQIEGLDFPPAVVKTYESAAGAIGVEDVSPFYVGLSVAAAGSIILLATCGCGGGGAGRKKKKAPSKKKKSKSKSKTGADTGAVAVASNGSAFKNGGSGVKAAAPMANGGGPHGLLAKQTNHKGLGRSGSTADGGLNGAFGGSAPALKTSKAAKKPPATKLPQVSEKARGNLARGAPPVITEEPEAAKKRVRKKEDKVGRGRGGTAAAAGAARASAVKKDTKNGVSANGSLAGGGEGYRAAKKEAHAVDSDLWEEKHGDEWQTVPITPPEEEWETVSHKRSRPRPRKEKAAVEAANVIPGGLGL